MAQRCQWDPSGAHRQSTSAGAHGPQPSSSARVHVQSQVSGVIRAGEVNPSQLVEHEVPPRRADHAPTIVREPSNIATAPTHGTCCCVGTKADAPLRVIVTAPLPSVGVTVAVLGS